MTLNCDQHYCQPFSVWFSSAILTQPDTTEGLLVEFDLVKFCSCCWFRNSKSDYDMMG